MSDEIRNPWDFGRIMAREIAAPTAKRPWQSRTYWFIGVSMLAKAAVMIPALSGLQIDVGATTDLIMLGVSFLADLGAMWGRDNAQGPIRWVGPLDGSAKGSAE